MQRTSCRLVRVLPQAVAFSMDVWVAMHGDLRRVRRIGLVFEALGAALSGFLADTRGD
ncbi:hypothetical protein [uncultured Pseudomonas sp.]|uniref:hypothetical protein n=1 Tax=uncultured Pseudomonas sp. TaxID=114707 RepID=UPI002588BBF6|nr:hypothetical protein [uncultured Pseudomonas sp.]